MEEKWEAPTESSKNTEIKMLHKNILKKIKPSLIAPVSNSKKRTLTRNKFKFPFWMIAGYFKRPFVKLLLS
jgi:hypothetical protein